MTYAPLSLSLFPISLSILLLFFYPSRHAHYLLVFTMYYRVFQFYILLVMLTCFSHWFALNVKLGRYGYC